MLDFVRRIFPTAGDKLGKYDRALERIEVPSVIRPGSGASFDLATVMHIEHGLPVPDWKAVNAWLGTLDAAEHGKAWSDVELAWMSCLRAALGEPYKVGRFGQSVILSSLDARQEQMVAVFMDASLKKIVKTLGRLASVPVWGYDILMVFDDSRTYYNYVSRYYPDEGEFAISSGMHISYGCGHFVTTRQDMQMIEPVIVHEMTHSCLAHLPIPVWLNEGLAVNTEQLLCHPAPAGIDPRERHRQHQLFWTPDTIQQLWSGTSFKRPDEGSELSYDIARILVSQMAKDWQQFEGFVLDADVQDGGQLSATDHYGITLGALICALLDKEYVDDWEPLPAVWEDPPERGGFRILRRNPMKSWSQ